MLMLGVGVGGLRVWGGSGRSVLPGHHQRLLPAGEDRNVSSQLLAPPRVLRNASHSYLLVFLSLDLLTEETGHSQTPYMDA